MHYAFEMRIISFHIYVYIYIYSWFVRIVGRFIYSLSSWPWRQQEATLLIQHNLHDIFNGAQTNTAQTFHSSLLHFSPSKTKDKNKEITIKAYFFLFKGKQRREERKNATHFEGGVRKRERCCYIGWIGLLCKTKCFYFYFLALHVQGITKGKSPFLPINNGNVSMNGCVVKEEIFII